MARTPRPRAGSGACQEAWPQPAGPRWALAGSAGWCGWARVDWVGPTGSAPVGKDKICFFPKYFSVQNKFRKNPENV
jgi:hypothetical protein